VIGPDIELLQRMTEILLQVRALSSIGNSAFRRSFVVYSRRVRRRGNKLLPDEPARPAALSCSVHTEALTGYRLPSPAAGLPRDEIAAVFRGRDRANPLRMNSGASYSLTTRRSDWVGARRSVITKGSAGEPGPTPVALQFPPTWSVAEHSRNLLAPSNRLAGRAHAKLLPHAAGDSLRAERPMHLRPTSSWGEARTVSFAPMASLVPPAGVDLPMRPAVKTRDEQCHENDRERNSAPALIGESFDGGALGQWMVDYLEHQLLRPRFGMTGVDPRVTPL